jgi:hypothetical protein
MAPVDLPRAAKQAAAYAESIAQARTARGGNLADLFAAFAGLVAAHDAGLAAQCLIALDEASRPGIDAGGGMK